MLQTWGSPLQMIKMPWSKMLTLQKRDTLKRKTELACEALVFVKLVTVSPNGLKTSPTNTNQSHLQYRRREKML